MTRARRGNGLLETLVALPLIALLGVVAIRLLLSVHRQVLHADGVIGASRELRHAASVLSAELRVLRARDLVAWNDTVVEFDGTVGVGIVCASGRGAGLLLLVAPSTASRNTDPVAATWNQPPQAGDRVEAWLPGASPADMPTVASATLRAISTGNECERSPLMPDGLAETTRLTLVDTLPGMVVAGAPVRVTRRTRYSLYRASDGDWFLGRRTRGSASWDIVQPVAGPLRSPRDRGLVIRVYDAQGAPVDGASAAQATRVSIELRAPRRSGSAAPRLVTNDSARIDVALRAERGRAP